MLPDGFEFFDGVSVWCVVVIERFYAFWADFAYQPNAVLLLITRQLNVAVMALFINVVFDVAEV